MVIRRKTLSSYNIFKENDHAKCQVSTSLGQHLIMHEITNVAGRISAIVLFPKKITIV